MIISEESIQGKDIVRLFKMHILLVSVVILDWQKYFRIFSINIFFSLLNIKL